MDLVQQTKSVLSISLAAGVASGATHTVAVDTLGFDAASIDVSYRSINHTAAPAVIAVKHSDTDASYGAITGIVQDTDYTVLGVANTATVNVTRFDINTRGLKRYLQVSVTPAAAAATATGNVVVVACRLGKGEAGIDSASDAGANLRVVK